MAHSDTKRLPRLKNQTVAYPSEYLFAAVDDYSRGLYAAILPDRTAAGAAKLLLRDAIDCCPYTAECAYSDNGMEYKGSASHPFGAACCQNNTVQKFIRIARPQTNGKAERVIRTLMEMRHDKRTFADAEQRRRDLRRFANFYNTAKPHAGLKGNTPFETLEAYFTQPVV